MGCEHLPMHDIIIAQVCRYTGWKRYDHPRQWHTAPRGIYEPCTGLRCNMSTLEKLAGVDVESIPKIMASYRPSRIQRWAEVEVESEDGLPLILEVNYDSLAWKFLEKRLEIGI